MLRSAQRSRLTVSIRDLAMSCVLLIGIVVILAAFVCASRILLYIGLCITGIGIGLGVIRFIAKEGSSERSTQVMRHRLY